jgi:hypothetical protein
VLLDAGRAAPGARPCAPPTEGTGAHDGAPALIFQSPQQGRSTRGFRSGSERRLPPTSMAAGVSLKWRSALKLH